MATNVIDIILRAGISDLENGIQRATNMVTGFATSLLAIGGVSIGIGAIKNLADDGIQLNATLEESKIGIAGLVTALVDVTDANGNALDTQQTYTRALVDSEVQVQKLRVAGLQTAATSDQLATAYQAAIGAGLSANMSLDQIRQITIQTTQAAGALSVPMAGLNQEVKALLSGNIDANAAIAKGLGITRAMVDEWKRGGTLFENLHSRMEAFSVAGEDIGRTWTATLSNIDEAKSSIAAAMTGGLMQSISTAAQQSLGKLFDVNSATLLSDKIAEVVSLGEEGYTSIGLILAEGISKGVDGLIVFNEWLISNQGQIDSISLGFSQIGGQVSGIVADVTTLYLGLGKGSAETGVISATLTTIALIVAGIRDGFQLITGSITWLAGAILQTPIIDKLTLGREAVDSIGQSLKNVGAAKIDGVTGQLSNVNQVLAESGGKFAAYESAIEELSKAKLLPGLQAADKRGIDEQIVKVRQLREEQSKAPEASEAEFNKVTKAMIEQKDAALGLIEPLTAPYVKAKEEVDALQKAIKFDSDVSIAVQLEGKDLPDELINKVIELNEKVVTGEYSQTTAAASVTTLLKDEYEKRAITKALQAKQEQDLNELTNKLNIDGAFSATAALLKAKGISKEAIEEVRKIQAESSTDNTPDGSAARTKRATTVIQASLEERTKGAISTAMVAKSVTEDIKEKELASLVQIATKAKDKEIAVASEILAAKKKAVADAVSDRDNASKRIVAIEEKLAKDVKSFWGKDVFSSTIDKITELNRRGMEGSALENNIRQDANSKILEARELQSKASAATDRGDTKEAQKLLDHSQAQVKAAEELYSRLQSNRTAIAGVTVAGAEQVKIAKEQLDIEKKIKSNAQVKIDSGGKEVNSDENNLELLKEKLATFKKDAGTAEEIKLETSEALGNIDHLSKELDALKAKASGVQLTAPQKEALDTARARTEERDKKVGEEKQGKVAGKPLTTTNEVITKDREDEVKIDPINQGLPKGRTVVKEQVFDTGQKKPTPLLGRTPQEADEAVPVEAVPDKKTKPLMIQKPNRPNVYSDRAVVQPSIDETVDELEKPRELKASTLDATKKVVALDKKVDTAIGGGEEKDGVLKPKKKDLEVTKPTVVATAQDIAPIKGLDGSNESLKKSSEETEVAIVRMLALKTEVNSLSTAISTLASTPYTVTINVPMETALAGLNTIEAMLKKVMAYDGSQISITVVQQAMQGLQQGGVVQGFEIGGTVTNAVQGYKLSGYGGGDVNLIAAERGEYVVRKERVTAYSDLVHAINSYSTADVQSVINSYSIRGYNQGGVVGSNISTQSVQQGQQGTGESSNVNLNLSMNGGKNITLNGSRSNVNDFVSTLRELERGVL